jgi:hypothetical protein
MSGSRGGTGLGLTISVGVGANPTSDVLQNSVAEARLFQKGSAPEVFRVFSVARSKVELRNLRDSFGSAIAHQLDESLKTSHHVINFQELLLLFDTGR